MITATQAGNSRATGADGGLTPALDEALASFAAGRVARAAGPAATLLKRGATTESWRVQAPGVDWVVRIGRGMDARHALDRASEARVLERVSTAGFAPPLVHVEPSGALLVVAYVAHEPLTAAAAHDPAFLSALGARLRALHALPWPEAAPVLDPGGTIARYLEFTAPQHAPVPRARLRAIVETALARYQPGTRRALCHFDLHRANVLTTAPLTFIDWEYAGARDPLLDLAWYVAFEHLDARGRQALLGGYGPCTGIDAQALDGAVCLCDCLRVAWTDAADGWSEVDPDDLRRLVARLGAAAGGTL